MMKSVCVFCGSNFGVNKEYKSSAASFGALLAGNNIRLIYGGGSVGLMGALADAALGAGGEVVGVIPRALWDREVGHSGLTGLHIVETMHERKALMADLADGFIALPGGIGTMEEIFEVWTWASLGIHEKPCGLLNIAGYYDALAAFLDHMAAEGFIKDAQRSMLMVDKRPETLIERFKGYAAPSGRKWLDKTRT